MGEARRRVQDTGLGAFWKNDALRMAHEFFKDRVDEFHCFAPTFVERCYDDRMSRRLIAKPPEGKTYRE